MYVVHYIWSDHWKVLKFPDYISWTNEHFCMNIFPEQMNIFVYISEIGYFDVCVTLSELECVSE